MRWLLCALLLALAGCGEDEKHHSDSAAVTLGPQAVLEIPAGAFEGSAQVSVASKEPEKVPSRKAVGRLWDVRVNGAEHTVFRKPVRIRVPFDASKVPAGKGVLLMVKEGGRWTPVPRCRVDAAAGFVVAAVTHLTEYQPVLRDEDIHLVARWYGQYQQQVERGPGLIGPPNATTTASSLSRSAFLVVREEVFLHRNGGLDKRFVVERAGVGIQMNAVTGRKKDGTPLNLRGAVNTSVSLGEEELTDPMDPEIQASLDEMYVELERLEGDLRQAEEEWEQARDRTAAQIRVTDAQERLATHKDNVRSREFYSRGSRCTLAVSDEGDVVHVTANVANPKFEYTHLGYVIHIGTTDQGPLRSEAIALSNSFSASGAPGSAISESKSSEGTNSRQEETTTFYRVPVDSERKAGDLRIAGSVYHRIQVPQGDEKGNWFESSPGQAWADVAARAIPVAGTVLLNAHLLDPDEPVEGAPVNSTRTGADGSFELRVPATSDRTLRLEMRWENRDAQLQEICQVDVPLWQVLTAGAAISGGGSTPAAFVSRHSTLWARYEKVPHEFDLGRSSRGGVVRKDDRGALSLEFKELDSVLVNTFVRRATHLNQNKNTFVVYVDPRQTDILERCPAALRDETVKRLAEEVADGRTPVIFSGSEVCYPSSTVMALDALRRETIVLDAEGKSQQLETLAQAVYDKALEFVVHGGGPAVRWREPPVPTSSEGERADELIAKGELAEAEKILAKFRKYWPYGPAEADHDNKEWLLTRDIGYRPWQHSDIVEKVLETTYPGLDAILHSNDARPPDLFSHVDHQQVLLHELGRGASGVASIHHESGEHGKAGADKARPWVPAKDNPGGHLLNFLGAVIGNDGRLVRLIVNDPHGDLSQNPKINGYYDTRPWPNGAPPSDVMDQDKLEHRGAYAPYGIAPDPTSAYEGTIQTKYYLVIRNSASALLPADLRTLLLPGQPR